MLSIAHLRIASLTPGALPGLAVPDVVGVVVPVVGFSRIEEEPAG